MTPICPLCNQPCSNVTEVKYACYCNEVLKHYPATPPNYSYIVYFKDGVADLFFIRDYKDTCLNFIGQPSTWELYVIGQDEDELIASGDNSSPEKAIKILERYKNLLAFL